MGEGARRAAKPARKIAILGTAPSWHDAPFKDSSWDIWTCNRAGLSQKPWHKVFEIHRNWDYESPQAKAAYLDDLANVKPPQQVVSIVPLGHARANLVLDRAYLFDKYDPFWFSSSFGYMAAHALEQKPTDIGFWGVDVEAREEYLSQFAGVRHFIGLAKALGIKVTIAEASALNRNPSPYADRWETFQAQYLDRKATLCETMLKKLAKDKDGARYWSGYYDGKVSGLGWDEAKKKERDAADDEAKRYQDKYDAISVSVERVTGELQATRHYQRIFVWNTVLPDGDTGAAGT